MRLDKVVVVDVSTPSGHPWGKNNLLFKKEAVGNARYLWHICHLYEECLKGGIQLLTPDLYFSLRPQIKKAILWRYTTMQTTAEALIRDGVHPAIFMNLEYPIHICDFYWNLEKLTAPYDYTLMPRGAQPFVSKKTKFRALIAPQSYPRSSRVEHNFKNRKFLTMISGNHRINPLRRLYATIANFIKPLPTLVNRETYLDRLEALCHFADNPGFDFYGNDWDKPVRFLWGPKKKRIQEAVSKTWRGSPADKFPVLQQYKFSICFESCIFGGYITEKIIDSMLAGCVPVYWGAPDVEEFIPPNCFIDFRKFSTKGGSAFSGKSYDELESFLNNIDEKTYDAYVDNINAFVASDKFKPFTQEQFAEDMIALFEPYF